MLFKPMHLTLITFYLFQLNKNVSAEVDYMCNIFMWMFLFKKTIALQCPRIHLVTSNQNKNNAMLPAAGNESHTLK